MPDKSSLQNFSRKIWGIKLEVKMINGVCIKVIENAVQQILGRCSWFTPPILSHTGT